MAALGRGLSDADDLDQLARNRAASQPAPDLVAQAFPPTDVHAPLRPWTPAECDDVLARWAAAGAAYRRQAVTQRNAGRNARMWRLYHEDGLTAEEIGRLFDLTASGVYAAIKRMRPDHGGTRKPSPGQRPPDYGDLVARVLALRDGKQLSETEIMTVLAMPRTMVAAILREHAA